MQLCFLFIKRFLPRERWLPARSEYEEKLTAKARRSPRNAEGKEEEFRKTEDGGRRRGGEKSYWLLGEENGEAASSKGGASFSLGVSRILRENDSGVFTIMHLKR